MLIPSYLNRLTLSSYRPATIDMRRRVLSNFDRTLPMGRRLEDATRQDCEAFIIRPNAPGSRRVYRTTLRHFYGWAVEEGFVTVNPAERVPPIRVKQGTPRPVSEDDLTLALSKADPRMRAWLLLMSLAGLRCLEVAHLAPGDLVRTESGWLLMLSETKGGAPAVVPAHDAVVAALLALPVIGGGWWSVTPKHVSQFTGRFLRGSGVDATAHQLRHTAATSWLRVSDDVLTVSRLMRHKSVASTQVYAELAPERPAQVVRLVGLAG